MKIKIYFEDLNQDAQTRFKDVFGKSIKTDSPIAIMEVDIIGIEDKEEKLI